MWRRWMITSKNKPQPWRSTFPEQGRICKGQPTGCGRLEHANRQQSMKKTSMAGVFTTASAQLRTGFN